MAKKLGKTSDYEYYTKRSLGYVEYFDSKSKFMRAKLDNGKYREPFNPFDPGEEWVPVE